MAWVDSHSDGETNGGLAARLQEGDPAGLWEENFKTHHDTKPRGPEAISLDLAFPAAAHVYGLPEHATSFALKPTTGVCPRSVCVLGHTSVRV